MSEAVPRLDEILFEWMSDHYPFTLLQVKDKKEPWSIMDCNGIKIFEKFELCARTEMGYARMAYFHDNMADLPIYVVNEQGGGFMAWPGNTIYLADPDFFDKLDVHVYKCFEFIKEHGYL